MSQVSAGEKDGRYEIQEDSARERRRGPLGRVRELPHGTTRDQIAEMESEGQAQQQRTDVDLATPAQDGREGATTKKSTTEPVHL